MIQIEPIGFVINSRITPDDDFWGGISSEVVLIDDFDEDCLAGIEEFSHAELIFHFHLVDDSRIETRARHPRNNTDWPRVGIFAQRGKNRPNKLGLTIVRIISREGRKLTVTGLDAVDGTPVIDIKPVMREFLPRDEISQPLWAAELMKNYWVTDTDD